MDENTSWQKQLLASAGLLVVVGLLVGGGVAVVALKAADVAGVGQPRGQSTEPPPGLGTSTTTPTPPPATESTTDSPATSAAPTTTTTTTKPKPTRPRPQPAIRLLVSPQQAQAYERVNLTGLYRGAADGTTLQVQRAEGSVWADFPTKATVSAGTFATYIETGVSGLNRLRMLDTATGRASNVVKVRIS